jgi:tRNA pseudouridine55 synthase
MNGTLIIDKPEGWTSHDVVAKLRGILKTRRIGHAGTLDPFATGVLVVCIGVATRLVQFLVGLDKEYIATVRLGFATDTQDLTGKPISPLVSSNGLTAEEIERVLFEFQGEQKQLPPMFSAKKVDGERLHKAARAGREVERQACDINIYSLARLQDAAFTENADGTRDFVMRVKCSSGTYIRTLAHDIGAKLGMGAHLSALRRTSVGHFDIARALSLSEVEKHMTDGTIETKVISLAETVFHLPGLRLNEEMVKQIAHGRELKMGDGAIGASIAEYLQRISQKYVSLCDEKGDLVGLGELVLGNEFVRPKIVLIQP